MSKKNKFTKPNGCVFSHFGCFSILIQYIFCLTESVCALVNLKNMKWCVVSRTTPDVWSIFSFIDFQRCVCFYYIFTNFLLQFPMKTILFLRFYFAAAFYIVFVIRWLFLCECGNPYNCIFFRRWFKSNALKLLHPNSTEQLSFAVQHWQKNAFINCPFPCFYTRQIQSFLFRRVYESKSSLLQTQQVLYTSKKRGRHCWLAVKIF